MAARPPAADDPGLIEGDMTGPDGNRRSHPRTAVTLSFQVILLTVPDCPSMMVQSVETSRSGMGFLARRCFQEREPIAVRLRFLNKTGKLVLAEVRNCQMDAHGVYRIGVEFIEAVTAGDNGNKPVPKKWLAAAVAWARQHGQ